jgi:NADPH:quinone reductase-like Zn-dependent oxidoreductase
VPGKGEFLVEVSGSSVNPCDVDYPAAVGGTVAAVGEGRRLKVGYRVWSDTGALKGDSGGMATYAVTTELQTGLAPSTQPD